MSSPYCHLPSQPAPLFWSPSDLLYENCHTINAESEKIVAPIDSSAFQEMIATEVKSFMNHDPLAYNSSSLYGDFSPILPSSASHPSYNTLNGFQHPLDVRLPECDAFETATDCKVPSEDDVSSSFYSSSSSSEWEPNSPRDDLRRCSNSSLGSFSAKRKRDEKLDDEEKRKRNCAASARFRQKKKQEMNFLEDMANKKSDECDQLQVKVKVLENEVAYLKQLLVLCSSSNPDLTKISQL
eukprot:Sdes_comp19512_c0_seq1m11065